MKGSAGMLGEVAFILRDLQRSQDIAVLFRSS